LGLRLAWHDAHVVATLLACDVSGTVTNSLEAAGGGGAADVDADVDDHGGSGCACVCVCGCACGVEYSDDTVAGLGSCGVEYSELLYRGDGAAAAAGGGIDEP
jgi:hypothetical protein